MPPLCLVLLLATAPWAQAADTLDGTWKAVFISSVGRAVSANVVLRGNEGAWRIQNPTRQNACLGMETPLVVERLGDDALAIEILYSKMLTGCPNRRMSLTASGNVLKGVFDDGREVELVRP